MTAPASSIDSDGKYKGTVIQALGIKASGLKTLSSIGAAAGFSWVAIGTSPVAASGTSRMPIAPDVGHYLKCAPGDKVAMDAGGTEAVSTVVGDDTSVVYVFYDSTNGTGYVMECA